MTITQINCFKIFIKKF